MYPSHSNIPLQGAEVASTTGFDNCCAVVAELLNQLLDSSEYILCPGANPRGYLQQALLSICHCVTAVDDHIHPSGCGATGCGDAPFHAAMYDAGYTKQACFDYSAVVIEQNKATYGESHPGLVCLLHPPVAEIICAHHADLLKYADAG